MILMRIVASMVAVFLVWLGYAVLRDLVNGPVPDDPRR